MISTQTDRQTDRFNVRTSHPAGSHANPANFCWVPQCTCLLFLYLHYLHTRAAFDYQHTRNSGLCLWSTGMVCFLLLFCLQRAIPSTAVSMTHMYWRCEEEVWTGGSKYLRKTTAAWTNAVSDEWSFMTEWGSDGFIQVQWEHWNLSFNVSHTMLDQRPVKGACYRVNTLSRVILVMLALLDKNKVS